MTATDKELSLFLYQAKRTGLDPLTRQIYCIKTKSKSGDKFSIQSTIDSSQWKELKQIVYGSGGINNVETFDNLQAAGRYFAIIFQVPGVTGTLEGLFVQE